jgi:NAD(P)H-quinone oxidoreductase subunit 4L
MTSQIQIQRSAQNTRAALGLAYLAMTTVLVIAYMTGGLSGLFDLCNIHKFQEVFVFGALAALAFLTIQFGATAYSILPAATFGSFVCLSLHQDPLLRYLTLAAILFAIGLYGMVVSRNAVRVLMSIELMLNAANLNLVAFSRYIDTHAIGQVFAIFVLTVAAAEAAVGLGIVLSIYRNTATVDMERFNLLKW